MRPYFQIINQLTMNIIKSSILLFSLFIISCNAPNESVKRFNIVWLVAEDLGLYIPPFGDSTISTPNLTRLAEEGLDILMYILSQEYALPVEHLLLLACIHQVLEHII